MSNYQDSRVIQYDDFLFSCIHRESHRESFSLKDHALIYVREGRLVILHPSGNKLVQQGECVFVRKDCSLTFVKSMSDNGEPYKAITMILTRHFLLDYFRSMRKDNLPQMAVRPDDPILMIPSRPDVTSLFLSLIPFFWSKEKPDDEWLYVKKVEGLNCILKTDNDVYASLFDFTSKWKIDLVDFMEKNYCQDLSMEDFANFTGRSLSTFNRDFRKAFGCMPQKWIKTMRLNKAKELLSGGEMKVQDAMMDVGFSNLSYFSREYKEAFGYPPSEEAERN